MSQFLRPNSDVTLTNISAGGYADIDEVSANSADVVRTNNLDSGNTAQYICGLTDPALTPGSGVFTVRYQAGKGGGGTKNVLLTVSVYEGATLRATDVQRTPGATPTSYSFTPDLSAVVDWTNVRLRFDFAGDVAGTGTPTGALTWAELEIPDGGGLPKVWAGAAWALKPVKVWNGSAWVQKPVKFWNGSAWVLI
jgi:hypothetical protein